MDNGIISARPSNSEAPPTQRDRTRQRRARRRRMGRRRRSSDTGTRVALVRTFRFLWSEMTRDEPNEGGGCF